MKKWSIKLSHPLYVAESNLCLACAESQQTSLLVILCSHHLSAGQM